MDRLLIAQLTDTHVLDPVDDGQHWVDNNGRLAEAIESLNNESPRPDLVVATGDMANNGGPEEYTELTRQLSALELPLACVPGNHDDSGSLRSTVGPSTPPGVEVADASGHYSWWLDLPPAALGKRPGLRIIGLDTHLPGKDGGCFDDERAGWLANAISGAEANGFASLIAMHHPPFLSGIEWMDAPGFVGAERFIKLVSSARGVDRVICGHLHRPTQAAINGVTFSVGPSTIQHVALDLEPGSPKQAILDPVGYQLHTFDGTTWVSHTRYLATGEKPFLFE